MREHNMGGSQDYAMGQGLSLILTLVFSRLHSFTQLVFNPAGKSLIKAFDFIAVGLESGGFGVVQSSMA